MAYAGRGCPINTRSTFRLNTSYTRIVLFSMPAAKREPVGPAASVMGRSPSTVFNGVTDMPWPMVEVSAKPERSVMQVIGLYGDGSAKVLVPPAHKFLCTPAVLGIPGKVARFLVDFSAGAKEIVRYRLPICDLSSRAEQSEVEGSPQGTTQRRL